MLVRVIATLALVLAAVPAPAQTATTYYSLSGSAARALSVALQSQYGRASKSIEEDTIVHIVPTSEGFQVRFERSGARSIVLCVSRTGTITTATMQSSSSQEVAIPGREAQAISVAFEAWKSGNATIPQARADFDADHFSVSEHKAILQLPTDRPGYYVSYEPPNSIMPASQKIQPLKCPAWAIYRVDPSLSKVFRQPPIC